MNDDIVIIIPARLGSTRLPNKPLLDIEGMPMIARVALLAREVNIGNVYVACCGDEIKNVVRAYDVDVIVTAHDIPSGTDRVYNGYMSLMRDNPKNFNPTYIVNLQGDMPYFSPHIITQTVDLLKVNPSADIATPIAKITSHEILNDMNSVKALIDEKSGYAIDFLRYDDDITLENAYKHIGMYVYRVEALKKFVALKQTKLEEERKLEQMRALENNMKIITKLIDCDEFGDVLSVDTMDDLLKARKIIREALKGKLERDEKQKRLSNAMRENLIRRKRKI